MPDIEPILRSELANSEKLLWSGVPRQGIRLRRSEALEGLLLSLIVMVAGPFLVSRLLGPHLSAAIRPEITVPVAVVCVIVRRLLLDARRRRSLCYGLTDVRALIVQWEQPRSVQSVLLVEPIDIQLIEAAGGRGSIEFAPPFQRTLWNYKAGFRKPAFVQIENAREVYDQFFGGARKRRRRAV